MPQAFFSIFRHGDPPGQIISIKTTPDDLCRRAKQKKGRASFRPCLASLKYQLSLLRESLSGNGNTCQAQAEKQHRRGFGDSGSVYYEVVDSHFTGQIIMKF